MSELAKIPFIGKWGLLVLQGRLNGVYLNSEIMEVIGMNLNLPLCFAVFGAPNKYHLLINGGLLVPRGRLNGVFENRETEIPF